MRLLHNINKKHLLASVFFLFSLTAFGQDYNVQDYSYIRGIYINQKTLGDTQYLNYLIQESKKVGINTFVIDYTEHSQHYASNYALVKQNNIRFVARIVIFPGGGTPDQVKSEAYWNKRYQLAEQAINLGADAIQLDYIRYRSSQHPSISNIEDIYNVIKWFKTNLAAKNTPLEIDVFGIASFGRSLWIGQDIKVFGNAVDGMCPMVYPSHYQPFDVNSKRPYFIIYLSLKKFAQQFNGYMPFKLHPYIEMTNYHLKQTNLEKQVYIAEELRAIADSNTNGWYAWSANNYYDNLFKVLTYKNTQQEAPKTKPQEKEPDATAVSY